MSISLPVPGIIRRATSDIPKTSRESVVHPPGVLDFYMCLVWKGWTVVGCPASVPLVAPNGLNEQLGSAEYAQPRLFRFKIKTWLRQLKALWPECPATISPTGDSTIFHGAPEVNAGSMKEK
jgi:hypothetical protein